MSLLVIGEAPPSNTHPRHSPMYPLPANSAGGRLCAMSGLGVRGWIRATTRINLAQNFEDYSATRYRAYFDRLETGGVLGVFDHCLLVGTRVRDAAGPKTEWPVGEIRPRRAVQGRASNVAWIPHPSGRNRWYNEQANKELVEALLRRLLGVTDATDGGG